MSTTHWRQCPKRYHQCTVALLERYTGSGIAVSYLSGGLDPLPDAEEADDPNQQQTQSQVPFNGADVIDTFANSQYIISTTKQNKTKQNTV